ncbi:MAG: Lrp/AsnC family transcriptional regulator [Epsilonproteobacteria bacterium]|nr:Lrp/AsnC family transcriptional regulator [Campylobacterota bacterium]
MKNQILLEIQHNFPLVAKPFEAIAQKFNISEDAVLEILQNEKNGGVIRQTSAIFDTKRLGYSSSLVAFCLDEDKIEDAVKIINSHPGISHNYLRSHKFNIWFTLAVPPNSLLGLEKTVKLIAEIAKANDFLILPTLKMFKISVKLDTTKQLSHKEEVAKRAYHELILTNEHFRVIELLQQDIKFINEPFLEMKNKLEIDYDRFFEIVNELKNSGVMRRFASILNHKKAGFSSNAMVVWEIDESRADELGRIAASFSAVSHCYLRPTFNTWKYNLFTMIHASSSDELQNTINLIASEIEFKSNMILHSLQEFKKVRIIYFSNEFAIWEKKYVVS